jgi:hypothetical protein
LSKFWVQELLFLPQKSLERAPLSINLHNSNDTTKNAKNHEINKKNTKYPGDLIHR